MIVRNNIRILPGKTGILALTLRPNKTSFTPRHTIIGKGIAYVKPLDQNLPLRPIEIEFENNHCCIEVHNTSDSTVEFLHSQEMAYFDARSKGLVQINNSKHFPIDQFLHDRMTPAEMPCITTRTEHPTRAFCSMVNFLSSFLPNLCRLLISIYDLQKKAKKFKWTEEAEKAFNEIKKLLINPPVLKVPTPDGLFRLKSDTSREGVGGTLLQKQGNKWVVIGYHSKKLPKSAKNFGITELELTGLLVNIHSFMQLLRNRYFEVSVEQKVIKYMIKSKTESLTMRLKTLLLKLSEYTIDLKYQKGSEMHMLCPNLESAQS